MTDITAEIDGQTIDFTVDYEAYLIGDALSPAGRDYFERVLRNLDAARAFAARHYLANYNDNWRDDDEDELDAAQFSARLTLSSIANLGEPEHATVLFHDGGLFLGHRVTVDFEGDQPVHAGLFG